MAKYDQGGGCACGLYAECPEGAACNGHPDYKPPPDPRDAEIAKLRAEVADYEAMFDLRWKSDQRAIKMWQKVHPNNDLVWPDHADLVVWLLYRDAERYLSAVAVKDAMLSVGTQAEKDVAELRSEVDRKDAALAELIRTLDGCPRIERGIGGMTIAAQIMRTEINRVPAWAIEEARAALDPAP